MQKPAAGPDDKADISLAERLFERIGEEIVAGTLPPGAKISEPALARRFGVSRSPLREALRRLEERKLITSARNVGSRVVSFSLAEVMDVYHAREALEGMASRLAAQRMSAAEIDDLRGVLEDHRRALAERTDGAYYQDSHDLDFHYRIARGSRSFLVEKILCEEFYLLIRLFRRRHNWIAGRGRRAWEEHVRILDAIRDGDAELAEILMRRHVAAARQSFEASLRRMAPDGAGPEAAYPLLTEKREQ
jgi:DNA-binding GntR family transcriptional regulator